MDAFLVREEKTRLKRELSNWADNAKVASLLSTLLTRGIIDDREHANIRDNHSTDIKKNEYFFTDVMLKLGRVKFHDFCSLLKEDDQHKYFGTAFANIVGHKVILAEPIGEAPADSEDVTAAGGENRQAVRSYGVKASKPAGIVFIIANYTDQLKGYKHDISNIKRFFEDKLDYQVVTKMSNENGKKISKKMVNLNKEDFLEALKDMKSMVMNTHDRFYLFVLSHGNESGICTYNDRKTITSNEIIAHFQHDQMSCMKGLPKVFFFQVCRGGNYVDTAGGSYSKKSPEKWEMPTEPIPTAADVMVCHSTIEENYSFVGKFGSPFITESINAFEKYCKGGEDLGTIMREVKEKVSCQKGYNVVDETDGNYEIVGEVGEEGSLKCKATGYGVGKGTVKEVEKVKAIELEVWQMSTVTDNLTRKLLLI